MYSYVCMYMFVALYPLIQVSVFQNLYMCTYICKNINEWIIRYHGLKTHLAHNLSKPKTRKPEIIYKHRDFK